MYPARTCSACGGVARVMGTVRKFGIESNAHYRCDSEKCRHVFTVMTTPGKRMALVLAVPLLVMLGCAALLNPSAKEGSLAPMAIILAVLLTAFTFGAVKQLRAERANPVPEVDLRGESGK
jgi:hypothetical protein